MRFLVAAFGSKDFGRRAANVGRVVLPTTRSVCLALLVCCEKAPEHAGLLSIVRFAVLSKRTGSGRQSMGALAWRNGTTRGPPRI